MACRGDVDTEDLERIVSIARSGENILCGYFKDFESCLSVEQKEKVIAAAKAAQCHDFIEEMYECEEDY